MEKSKVQKVAFVSEAYCETCKHSLGVYGWYQLNPELQAMRSHINLGHKVVMNIGADYV